MTNLQQHCSITVIGLGPVGLTTVLTLAEYGLHVTALELNLERANAIAQGQCPYFEAGLEELIRTHVGSGRVQVTSDTKEALADADVVFMCVGTPKLAGSQLPDLSQVYGAVEATLNHHVTRDYPVAYEGEREEACPVLLVEKSTVPPGTGRAITSTFSDGRIPFEIVSNPEFLREGTALWDTLFPDRVVVGTASEYATWAMQHLYGFQERYLEEVGALRDVDKSDETAMSLAQGDMLGDADKDIQAQHPPLPEGAQLAIASNAHEAIMDTQYLWTNVETAELVKHASNSFLATKISYINFIARICEATGADVDEVAFGMGLDQRISPKFLRAGLGYGGSCFPKDVRALQGVAKTYGIDASILAAVEETNETTKGWAVGQLLSFIPEVREARITVLGYAFKPGTDDIREAPATVVVDQLVALGAHVVLSDPVALHHEPERWPAAQVTRNPDPLEAIVGADAVLVVTEWDQFRELTPEAYVQRMRGDLVIDARNVYEARAYRAAGLRVVTIGNRP